MLGRERYYVAEGQGHDELMRCKDCQALVTMETIRTMGMCPKCGNKRFNEITLLNDQEMADIQSGKLDFKFRDQFLAEFSAMKGSDVHQ